MTATTSPRGPAKNAGGLVAGLAEGGGRLPRQGGAHAQGAALRVQAAKKEPVKKAARKAEKPAARKGEPKKAAGRQSARKRK